MDNSPGCVKVYSKVLTGKAGITPELNTEPLSAAPGCPLVTVCGCPTSPLSQFTEVSTGIAIFGG